MPLAIPLADLEGALRNQQIEFTHLDRSGTDIFIEVSSSLYLFPFVALEPPDLLHSQISWRCGHLHKDKEDVSHMEVSTPQLLDFAL